MLNKQDEMLKMQDETIDALRQDLELYLDERFRKVEMKIEKIGLK